MPFKLETQSGEEIPYSRSMFSGGELNIRVDPDQVTKDVMDWDQVTITAHMRSPSDIMELAMLTNIVTRASWNRPKLIMPYVPYARQDRICQPGEDFSIKTFANIINDLGFQNVEVWDIHSMAAAHQFTNLTNIEADRFARMIRFEQRPIVVAPDKGAKERARKVGQALGYDVVVQALKVRTADNSSVSIELENPNEQFGNNDLLIVDDICDGGRTFIELAKILRPLTTGRILLYVTHGIFSNRGIAVFDGIVDAIFCPNIWPKHNWDQYKKVQLRHILGVVQ